MFATLKHFSFGNEIINWIKVLYVKLKCCIVNNNFLSPFLICKKVQGKEIVYSMY